MADDGKGEVVGRDLLFDKLVSGDRPSILALGLYGAESIKQSRMAVFMVDVLGRIRLMPLSSVVVKSSPRIDDAELDSMTEDDALAVLIEQGDHDNVILKYLKGRTEREGGRGVEDL
jgi:hypothetical protein